MRALQAAVIAMSFAACQAFAQAPAPKPSAPGTVKAVQPGLFEVAGPRVNDVAAAGITKITATPGKGRRSIHVESPWGDSFFPWPKHLAQTPFTISVGTPSGGATITAPGFTAAKRDDYRKTIESIATRAIKMTQDNMRWQQGSDG
jgi:hypothetical protein